MPSESFLGRNFSRICINLVRDLVRGLFISAQREEHKTGWSGTPTANIPVLFHAKRHVNHRHARVCMYIRVGSMKHSLLNSSVIC